MHEPSPLFDLFYFILALMAIFVPLGAVAFIVTRASQPKGKPRQWSLR